MAMKKYNLPCILQKKSTDCGVACVEMVLEYFKINKRGLESLANSIDGVQVRTIESFLREKGMHVIAGNLNYAHLKHFMDYKVPIICLQKDHYVVAKYVADYSIYYNCPIQGECKIRCKQFMREWWNEKDGEVLTNWGIIAWTTT
jgi:ABC-type bacteriocin/lantibiotic exporter with double-glycine peptidase domain